MKNDRERGEVVVEASIVVTLVTILITIMLYLGMVLYQKTIVTVMANHTASNLAQVYSNNLKDPFTGYIAPEKVYQSVTYSNMKTDAYLDVIEQKANIFAQYRLKSSSILPKESTTVEVDIVKKPNEILKSQIVVTIKEKMNIPLVGFFGVDGKIEYSASGRADCIDILEYLNGVEAVGDPDNPAVPVLPEDDTYLITFVVDEYSGKFFNSVLVECGESILTSRSATGSVMPANPINQGMKFKGWKMSNGALFSAGTVINKDTTVYGTWECTVTFDPDGGKVSPQKKAVPFMKTVSFPEPERSGYAFEGWYTEKNGGGQKYESGTTLISGNITLYAKWRCIHAAYNSSCVDKGNCKTPSTWLYKCKTCDHSEYRKGDYGSCVSGTKHYSTAASCTQQGIYTLKCQLCDKSILDNSGNAVGGVESALGHRYASGTSGPYDNTYYKAPTCSETGLKGSICSRCGDTKGEPIDYVDHNYTGRCGTTHTLMNGINEKCECIGAKVGDLESSIVIDACKDQKLRTFQCKVCRWCGQFQTEGTRQTSTQPWKLSNGTTMYSSRFVWCWDHHPSFEELIPVVTLKYEHKVN